MMPIVQLAQRCAPSVAPTTMAAIVRTESGGNPWVLWDNTTHRGYHPNSRQEALRILRTLMAEGHQVDVGIAQIDTENFVRYHLTPQTALDACTNLRAGGEILRHGWQQALAHGLTGQSALYHTLETYNSGHLFGDSRYANRVFHAAGAPVFLNVSEDSASADFPQYRWTAKMQQGWALMP